MGPIERLVAISLRQRLFVLLCLVAAIATGVAAYRDLPVEAFPDLTNNQVVVVAEAPSLAAIEVEQRVTFPVETALMGVPGAEQVRSISKAGLSIVTIVFEDSVPTYFARQLVSERVGDARGRLPAGVEPVLGPVATAFGEIYQYLIDGEGGEAEAMERKSLHDWDVRARLRTVKGVSEVNSWGGLTREYQVIVDPLRLERHELSLRDVFDAIARNNASFSGGFIEHRSERFTMRGTGLVSDVGDLRAVAVTAADGVPVVLSDVAEVRVAPMPRHGAVTRDGRGETLAGMVIMLKGENGKAVAERVKDRLGDVAGTLPAGTSITPFYDQTEVIDRTASTVRRNLLEGSVLVVVILFIFLRDIPAALITAAVIPCSMLIGFIGMRVFGVSANLMSLGAIDFGLIVDGAVVMMENFIRRRAESGHQPLPRTDAGRVALFSSAATEVARPILFGVLIIIAVYLPIFTLEGLEGKMFRPMAITVCSAILGSLLLSLTAVPVVSSWLLGLRGAHHEERWFTWLRARYVRHLTDAMNHPRRTLAIALAVVTVAVGSIPFLGTEFMPKLDEGALLIETRKLPSVSLEESVALSTRVEKIVVSFPEVKQVVTKIGRPDVATEAMGIYQGDVYVQLHPIEQWTTGRSKEALIEALSAALEPMPGVSFNFTQPMAMRLDEVVSGVKADVALKVFGPDPATLERLGADLERALTGVDGVADLQTERLSGAAQVQVTVDRARVARYGLSVDDVQMAVEAAAGGALASEVLDGPRRFPVVVRYPDAVRASPEAISALVLSTPKGGHVPLRHVADVRESDAPELIAHEGAERRLVVQMNVRGRDIGSFVSDARQRVAGAVTMPAGYRLEWGGQFENQARATARLAVVVPLSIVIIFLLLFVTFGELRQAGLVILNVPFALVGGIAALWLRGLNLNLSAAVGFIALFGVAVLNGVVLIAAVNRLREDGRSLREAVLDGAATRLRPVLMTALVASFGFVPMAISHGAGAEIQRPLATVVIGGVITSTLLTLIVLPTLYERIERRSEAEAEAEEAEAAGA